MIRAGSGSIDLPSLVSALWACAKEKRVRKVYERANLSLPLNEDRLIRLCLHMGPRYAIDKILEEEEQIRELCLFLDLDKDLRDDLSREQLIDVVIDNVSRREIKCWGVQTVLKNAGNARLADENLLPDLARRCFLVIEGLMIDLYKLYIAKYLYRFLDTTQQASVRNSLNTSSLRFSNAIEQLIKYDDEIKQGLYQEFQEELERISGQRSIFCYVDDIKTPLELANIRNNFLSHPSNYSEKEITAQSRRFFDLAGSYFEQLQKAVPIAIIPVEYGINEWGHRYFAYIDEFDVDFKGLLHLNSALSSNGVLDSRKCKRLYLYTSTPDFLPLQKAYCFHPDRSFPMCDPVLNYASSLRDIGGTLF